MATNIIDVHPAEPLAERIERYWMLAKHWWAREHARLKQDPLVNLSLDLLRRYLIRNAMYRPATQKCWGCGSFGTEMKWSNDLSWPDGNKGAVVFRCKHCSCIFAQRPIFLSRNWRIDNADELRHLFFDAEAAAARILKEPVKAAGTAETAFDGYDRGSARPFGEQIR